MTDGFRECLLEKGLLPKRLVSPTIPLNISLFSGLGVSPFLKYSVINGLARKHASSTVSVLMAFSLKNSSFGRVTKLKLHGAWQRLKESSWDWRFGAHGYIVRMNGGVQAESRCPLDKFEPCRSIPVTYQPPCMLNPTGIALLHHTTAPVNK